MAVRDARIRVVEEQCDGTPAGALLVPQRCLGHPGQRGQRRQEPAAVVTQPVEYLRQPGKLHPEDGRGNLVDPELQAREDRRLERYAVVVGGGVVHDEGSLAHCVVAGDNRPPFTGSDNLRLIEAEHANVADGAQPTASVAAADRLTGVLDDDEAVLPGSGHDRAHVARDPGHMHRQHGPGPRCAPAADLRRIQ